MKKNSNPGFLHSNFMFINCTVHSGAIILRIPRNRNFKIFCYRSLEDKNLVFNLKLSEDRCKIINEHRTLEASNDNC